LSKIAAFIEKQGFFVIDQEPTMEERRAHARIAKVIYEGGYRASRTPMDLPMSKTIVDVVRAAAGNNTWLCRRPGEACRCISSRIWDYLGGRADCELRQSSAQLG